MPKNVQTTAQIALMSHASKVMLKIFQARLQQYVNCELPDVQAGFRKGRGTKDQIANIRWIIEKKQESSRKTSISASLTILKPLTVWITRNCGKFLKRWEYQITWPASWDVSMQLRKQQLDLDVKQKTGSKLGKSMSRLYIVTLLIEFIFRVHHEKRWAGWSTSWNQDCREK